MNRLYGAFALIVLAAGSVAAAQTTPPAQPSPSVTTPSEQTPSDQTPNAATSSAGTEADKKQQTKDCIAREQANKSDMSTDELKKYCERQVNNPPQG